MLGEIGVGRLGGHHRVEVRRATVLGTQQPPQSLGLLLPAAEGAGLICIQCSQETP